MTCAELLALCRFELSDMAEPYLWPDASMYGFIDDAQKMFCRWTDGISDASTTEVVDVPWIAADEWLDLHPSILKIRSASRASTGRPIEIINQEDMPGRGMYFDTRDGPVRQLIVGMEENRARAYPIASDADTLKLVVFRLPLQIVSEATDDDELEIGKQHHRHLSLWVKHLAYGVQDSDGYDATKSAKYEQDFRAYCDAAQREQRNKRHKVRKVAYGGIY